LNNPHIANVMHILPLLLCILFVFSFSESLNCYENNEFLGKDASKSTKKVEVLCKSDHCLWLERRWSVYLARKIFVPDQLATYRACPSPGICTEEGCKEVSVKIEKPLTNNGKTPGKKDKEVEALGGDMIGLTKVCCCEGDRCNDQKPDLPTKEIIEEERRQMEEEL
ncbi:hypothetical protein PMAYCL1PPCAC_05702, partial [Pristionchus mayeri]